MSTVPPTAPALDAAGPEGPPSRDAPRPADTTPRPRGPWAPLLPLVLRLHFYAGVCVAPFLLVAAVTGFLYAGAFQAERLLYAHETTVPSL